MRTYLISTVYALALSQFFVALVLASPIPFLGVIAREYSNPNRSKNLSPLVVRSSPIDSEVVLPPDLWSDEIGVPIEFLPPDPEEKPLNMKIPREIYPEGMISIINIAGLIRTALENCTSEKKNTGRFLTGWISRLKKKSSYTTLKLIFPEGRGHTHTQRLQGPELLKRKEFIREVVLAHNKGIWYQPTADMEGQIKKVHRCWDDSKMRNEQIIAGASHKAVPKQSQQLSSSPISNLPVIQGSTAMSISPYSTLFNDHRHHTPMSQGHPVANTRHNHQSIHVPQAPPVANSPQFHQVDHFTGGTLGPFPDVHPAVGTIGGQSSSGLISTSADMKYGSISASPYSTPSSNHGYHWDPTLMSQGHPVTDTGPFGLSSLIPHVPPTNMIPTIYQFTGLPPYANDLMGVAHGTFPEVHPNGVVGTVSGPAPSGSINVYPGRDDKGEHKQKRRRTGDDEKLRR